MINSWSWEGHRLYPFIVMTPKEVPRCPSNKECGQKCTCHSSMKNCITPGRISSYCREQSIKATTCKMHSRMRPGQHNVISLSEVLILAYTHDEDNKPETLVLSQAVWNDLYRKLTTRIQRLMYRSLDTSFDWMKWSSMIENIQLPGKRGHVASKNNSDVVRLRVLAPGRCVWDV